MEGRLLGDVVLWKEKARTLQLQIRDRFRVAVDRRRQWYASTSPAVPPSYYCRPTIRRWIQRLRGFLHDAAQMKTSPSTAASRFYCKRVGKDVEAIDDSVILRFLQALAVPVIGSACHVFMHGLNHIQIYGAEKLHKALLERPQGKPLLTVSNHVAAVDDPFVIASLLPPNVMLDARNIRWTLCATDRCFSNPMFSAFFRCVKVLPVSRGDGIYQKGMDLAISKLNNGGWVHIFPEGSRSRDGGRTMGAAKRGVGRLVMDADKIPIVVPFVHVGMQDIMPVGTHFPLTGKRVTILVGDPIQFDDLLPAIDEANCMETPRGILYDSVSSRIGNRLQELKIQVERLVFEQCLEAQSFHQSCREDADGIWQLVDWEMFGFDNYTSSTEWTPPVSRAVIRGTSPLHNQQQISGNICQSVKAGFLQGGGIVSRIRGYMNPSELMGFAASGLFVRKDNLEHNQISFQEVGPIKAWRSFFEENVLHTLNNI